MKNHSSKIKITYQSLPSSSIGKIECQQKVYYYSQCTMDSGFFSINTSNILIIKQSLSNQWISIPQIANKSYIHFTFQDYFFLKKEYSGYELDMLSQYKKIGKNVLLFIFSNKKSWKIIFSDQKVRNGIHEIIQYKKKSILSKNLKNQQQQKNIQLLSVPSKSIKQDKKQITCKQKQCTLYKFSQIKKEDDTIYLIKNIIDITKTQYINIKNILTMMKDLKYTEDVAVKIDLIQRNFQRVESELLILQKKFKPQLLSILSLKNEYKQLSALRQENSKLLKQNNNQRSQVQQLEKQNSNNLTLIKDKMQLQTELQLKKKQNQQLKKQNQNFKIHIQNIKSEVSNNRKQFDRQMAQLKQSTILMLQQKYNILKQDLKEKQIRFKQKDQLIQRLQKQLQKKTNDNQEQILNLNKSLKESTQLSDRLQKQLQKKTLQIQTSSLQHLQNQINYYRLKYDQLQLSSILQGEVLRDPSHKEYLRDTIKNYTSLNISQTKLIYKYDPLNNANFHIYIDNHPNILLVIKTSNGSYLAAYSRDPFSTNAIAPTSCGIIMSLTNKKAFYVQKNKKSVVYDEFYLIFGNSEIRLKSQQNILFSNFGIANGYFDTKGLKADVLLNSEGLREVQMESFEVHQLQFKQ